ncbi:F-box/kelch-repeat protein At3g23880-like [Trifolium pratense]|uniref:F-box/kelch-repeat protein At3g23880-like n=1 Tax=Trifolium pratense TaxID=57577 RepID=UPI001E691DBA|nr:F-box/kelch-repeat protein At3g23880-like [Trifolium pratense]
MVFLPEELLAEILPFFDVKTILRLKCLSKSWFSFISDSNFIDKHLKNSSQNPHLTLFWYPALSCFNVVPFPVYRILKNPSIKNLYDSPKIPSIDHIKLVGSCNGLLCLLYYSRTAIEFSLWNPATRKISKKLGLLPHGRNPDLGHFDFTFGYDATASTRDYKVVAFRAKDNEEEEGSWKSEVKVFSVGGGGDNCWRNIQSFPVVPFNWFDTYYHRQRITDGVHFSGTVNWLAVDNSIVSLYLSTETYKQFLMPPGFDDEVPLFKPVLRVLMDCLCFYHDSNKTEFVLWQMKQYGVRESWTQLFKISYQNLQMHASFQLACLYVNGDMAIFADESRKDRYQAFIYNLNDKTVERIKCRNNIRWFEEAKDYVESLVSVCWE